MTKYDFNGMLTWMQGHDWPSKKTDTLAEACPQLDHLITWTHQQLQKYSFDRPLKVLGRGGKTFYYWPASFGGVKLKVVPNEVLPADGTASATSDIKIVTLGADQIQPLGMVGIIRTLIKENAPQNDPASQQLRQEVKLFIQTYHIVIPNRPGSNAAPSNVTPESDEIAPVPTP
jgi:hypothetical protein